MVSRVQIVLCRTRKKASNLQREHILNIFLTRDSVTIREAETLLSQAGHTVSLGTVSRMMKMLCSIGFLMTSQYGEETWYQLVPLDRRAARMVYARGTRMRW
jgi:Fe2+ or Zn2+ uptake regulation protein